jgi:exosortase D (VPLPA-CTERM-specific)
VTRGRIYSARADVDLLKLFDPKSMTAAQADNIRAPQIGESRTHIIAITAVLVALLAYSGALLELAHRWGRQEEYSHGFLIPFVTAWLLWTRRDSIRANHGRPSWSGVALVFLALAIHIVGELSAIFILSEIGFVVVLMGIALGVGGYSLLKLVFIPLAFLLFAIPLPYFIDAILTLRLQLISSELGVFFIRLFGIAVYLDGNIVDMGDYKLQVVEACSGLRYLYPLLSLSFLAAYLFHAPIWQRVVVFLSAIPIAIGMNGLRIGLVGILVERWGTQAANSTLHFFEGWVIFVACAVLLAAEMCGVALLSGKGPSSVFYFPWIAAKPVGRLTTRLVSPNPIASCLVLLCGGALAMFFLSGRSETIQARTRFAEFPDQLGQWQGHPSSLDVATEQALGFDDYILSDYSRTDGSMVNLYVAYYASQRKGESPHSPIVCIPGGGWAITSLQKFNYVNLGQELPLNRVVIEKGVTKQLVYYWFDERGRKVASEYWAKFLLFADAIVKNRTDGALVRLTTEIAPDERESDADRRLQGFMQAMLPRLTQFLPAISATPAHSAILHDRYRPI